MKLCTDCKYYHDNLTVAVALAGLNRTHGHLCGVEGVRDPIDGTMMYRSCQWMRSTASRLGMDPMPPYCGPDGDLFEPKS